MCCTHRSDRFRDALKTHPREPRWLLCHLPCLRPLLQIEVLAPIAAALPVGRASGSGSFHRRGFSFRGRDATDRQVSFPESDRDGTVEPVLHPTSALRNPLTTAFRSI